MNNIFGNLLGQAQMGYGNPGQHGQGQQGLQNQQWAHQLAAQQAAAYNQQLGRQAIAMPKYMIDGQWMNFDEFIDALYPVDCPERTMLILKLKKED